VLASLRGRAKHYNLKNGNILVDRPGGSMSPSAPAGGGWPRPVGWARTPPGGSLLGKAGRAAMLGPTVWRCQQCILLYWLRRGNRREHEGPAMHGRRFTFSLAQLLKKPRDIQVDTSAGKRR